MCVFVVYFSIEQYVHNDKATIGKFGVIKKRDFNHFSGNLWFKKRHGHEVRTFVVEIIIYAPILYFSFLEKTRAIAVSDSYPHHCAL